MTIEEAKALLAGADITSAAPQSWADLGCGSGLFSRALAELLPGGSHLLCLDQNRQEWDQLYIQGVTLEFRQADFVRETLPVSDFDGVLMANSLHYVSDQAGLIERLRGRLAESARFLIVEYDTARANRWVPYPLPFAKLKVLFSEHGSAQIRKIGQRRSVYGPDGMYAAEISR